MSASLSGMRGGQPSTTQPMAGPWLSPQVVMRNRWPKVLCDTATSPLRYQPMTLAISGAAGFFMPTMW